MTSPVHEPSEYLSLLWSSLLQAKLVSGTEQHVRLSLVVLHKAMLGYARESAQVTTVLCSMAPFDGNLHVAQNGNTGEWEIQRESDHTRERDLARTLDAAAGDCHVLAAVLDRLKPTLAAQILLGASSPPVIWKAVGAPPTAPLASFDVAALDRAKRWIDE